jgi:hypothetical protein
MVHIDMGRQVSGQYSKPQDPKIWERGGEEREYASFGPITLKRKDLSHFRIYLNGFSAHLE